MTVEPESTPTKTAAPPAETETPNIESESKPLIEVPQISKKMKAAAKGFGIDLEGIITGLESVNSWAASMENRMQLIQNQMPDQIQQAMENAIESQRRKQAEMLSRIQPSSAGQDQGGGMLGGLGQAIGPALLQGLLGGGGQDEEMQKLTKAIMAANLKRIEQDGLFTEAIKNAIVSKIAGKAAASIAEGL